MKSVDPDAPTMVRRPLFLTLIACLFILVGVGILLLARFFALLADPSRIHDPLGRFQWDDVLAIAVGAGALLGGTLVLRRQAIGRWLIVL